VALPDNVTFAVYREGPMLGLYLAPIDLVSLHRALDLPDDDQAAILDPIEAPRICAWTELAELEGEAEVVHMPKDHAVDLVRLPYPLLASPSRAVPQGSQAAISLQDGCHGVVLSPHGEVLARCLMGFVRTHLEQQLGDVKAEELPTLPAHLLAPFVEPIPPGAWYGMHLDLHKRYWLMEFELHDEDDVHPAGRWVAEGAGGRWRGGWSW
jgi:hypothetical protein